MSENNFRNARTITPNDTVALGTVDCIYVGGAGNVTLRTDDDDADVVFTAVPVGTFLRVRAKYVRATGTTATALVGLST